MGWNDRMMAECELQTTIICPQCKSRLKVRVCEQVPGFRSAEELECPKCGKKIMESMRYEFSVEEL